MITAILNGYRRGENLDIQIEALKAQTVPPKEILVWYNNPGIEPGFNFSIQEKAKTAFSSHNFGVWARFAFALNASTEYICIFDDDTIPGSRWFENCLNTMSTQEALLGTAGILYLEPPLPESHLTSYYNAMHKIGWYQGGNFDVPTEVDFVGHAWFFKRSWLSVFWRELPDPRYTTCGEDMHFSYMLQKYLAIPTVVPPHPVSDKSLWGSVAGELGVDIHSLWESNAKNTQGIPFKNLMNEFFIEQRQRGWRLVNDK